MTSNNKRRFIFFNIVAAIVLTAVSCNSKATDDETEIAVTPAIVAVKNFHLMANDTVLKNLDSVFFSIDLVTGVIFNADSLPLGTDVSRLIPSITFSNTMTKADLIFYKDNDSQTTSVDYLKNPTDTIDFTKPVVLDVTAQDGVSSFSYTIKVNVHTQVPDTVIWDRLAHSSLPSATENPVAQKTIAQGADTYCLVEEYNNQFTISKCSDLFEGIWSSQPFEPGFAPKTETFTATSSAFYILDVYGNLFMSLDLSEWTDTGEIWTNILGAYGDAILGVRFNDEDFLHTQYPKPEGYVETVIEDGFPIYGFAPLGVFESRWAPDPMAILACGLTEGGEASSKVWAYDGTTWAVINYDTLPALENPMMVRYVVYRDTPAAFAQREFDVWMLFGGLSEDGEMNRKVYISYDNGVHWSLAPEGMQLPENFPDLGGANLIVEGHDLSSDLSEAWTLDSSSKSRASYVIDGFEITWNCPYLYIFGGYSPYPDNSLNTVIYRGVLERLKFTPVI